MDPLYLYLQADTPKLELPADYATPVVIGDLDTREPARREGAGAVLLSLI